MATTVSLETASKNIGLNAVFDQLNSGFCKVYSGTKPATPSTAIAAQVLLAECTFGAVAFAPASGGTKVANAITQDSVINATGLATWSRWVKSDGTTVVADVDVGIIGSGNAVEFGTVTTDLVAGAIFQVSSMTITG